MGVFSELYILIQVYSLSFLAGSLAFRLSILNGMPLTKVLSNLTNPVALKDSDSVLIMMAPLCPVYVPNECSLTLHTTEPANKMPAISVATGGAEK